MSMIGILRRNWALRVSVVLNICVLLYVCAHFGSSGPWIEEPPTNWAAPLQSEAFGAADLVNGTQKGATSSSVTVAKDASNKGGNGTSPARTRPPTTRPTSNEAKAETVQRNDQRNNQTVSWYSDCFSRGGFNAFVPLRLREGGADTSVRDLFNPGEQYCTGWLRGVPQRNQLTRGQSIFVVWLFWNFSVISVVIVVILFYFVLKDSREFVRCDSSILMREINCSECKI